VLILFDAMPCVLPPPHPPTHPPTPTQVGQLKGFSYTNKDRWVVIAPRFTPPPPGGSVGEVRVMMLLFRNAAEADPRTKVWLDGAAISMRDDEAVLVGGEQGWGAASMRRGRPAPYKFRSFRSYRTDCDSHDACCLVVSRCACDSSAA